MPSQADVMAIYAYPGLFLHVKFCIPALWVRPIRSPCPSTFLKFHQAVRHVNKCYAVVGVISMCQQFSRQNSKHESGSMLNRIRARAGVRYTAVEATVHLGLQTNFITAHTYVRIRRFRSFQRTVTHLHKAYRHHRKRVILVKTTVLTCQIVTVRWSLAMLAQAGSRSQRRPLQSFLGPIDATIVWKTCCRCTPSITTAERSTT